MVRSALGEQVAPVADVPFAGGALGYWGYDLARDSRSLSGVSRERRHQGETTDVPAMAIGIYDWALVLDHHRKTACLVSHQRFEETTELLEKILFLLNGDKPLPADTFRVHGDITSDFTSDSYAAAFAKVQYYLQEGDCYQVNLAQCFCANATGNALNAYLELRRLTPAPYSAFINLPKAQILCASPECFLHVQGGRVKTKPIKGTRKRSSDTRLDRQLADDLRNHPKDRAENLMIVDLLRSDLGKNCVSGSVHVSKLFEVESFSNVHHLVSTIEGRLAGGRDALHLLRDCFPGGSVTGAPKQRAMQIIEQLEPHSRGLYCGAIGYIGFDGNMDTNIAIRTLVYSSDAIRFWVGGGIVADSEVAAEYQETLDKAAGMIKLLQQYGGKCTN
jgi:para-aminobenzoate synthetase component 1